MNSLSSYIEKLDDNSVKAILVAQEESRRLGHKLVDTEQLLLGLLVEKQGAAGRVLEKFGLSQQLVRKRIVEIRGRGHDVVGVETDFTEKMKRVLDAACLSAQECKNEKIRTQDLLLGLMQVQEGIAAQIFNEAGISPDNVIHEVTELRS